VPTVVDHMVARAGRRFAQFRAACVWSIARSGEVGAGPGMGLRFNAGANTPQFISGDYERPVQEALQFLVRPGDVCYDVGANLGFFTLLLGRFTGESGMVYAFEPVPKNASAIERNARLNSFDNVAVMRMALSRDEGKSELLLARHVGGAVLKSAGIPPDPAGSLMVSTTTVDLLVGQQKIKPPNVVKIDVEGAEMDVLRGMESVLRKWRPKIVLEFDDPTKAGCEAKLSACQDYLTDFAYETMILPGSYPDGGWFVRHIAAVRK